MQCLMDIRVFYDEGILSPDRASVTLLPLHSGAVPGCKYPHVPVRERIPCPGVTGGWRGE